MVKLLNVDTPGERALRVVAYFDQLVSHAPDLEAVVRATAVIADCPAGLDIPSRGLFIRYSSEGVQLHGPGTLPSQRAAIDASRDEHGTLWLERPGGSHELDEFILERFTLTVSAVLTRQRSSGAAETAVGLSDPALAQLFVNPRSTEAERSRAARLIGLQPNSSVQLIAVDSSGTQPEYLTTPPLRAAWRRPVHVAPLSRNLSLIIAEGQDPVDWAAPHGLTGRAASGPVVDILDAPRSWGIARETLRFAQATTAWPRLLDSDQLGAVRLIGSLDATTVVTHPDVIRLEQLASSPRGTETIEILDHYLHADSLRSAARALNFHHSSLHSKLTRIGQILEMDLRAPAGRERARLGLLLWKLFRADL